MELRLDIGPNRLTLDDLIAVEEAETSSARELRDMLSRFVVDEKGEAVPADDAVVLVGKLTLTQVKEAMENVAGSVSDAEKDAVSSET